MKYHLGLPPHMRHQAAVLYEEAFRQKLAPIIWNERQRIQILETSLIPELAVVAVEGPTLAGLAGFHHSGRSFTGGCAARDVLNRLGLLKGLWAIAGLALFEQQPVADELLLDGIVVRADMRGQGIGGTLLDHLSAYAGSHGYRQLRLEVVDTNPGARRLYQRKGFVPTGTQSLPYLRRILGFGAATTMVKELGGRAGFAVRPHQSHWRDI